MATNRMPSLYIAHGGGPCFFMDPPAGYPHLWDRLAAHLKDLAATLPREPKAILAISGHWEEPVVTVNSGTQPPMLFDYYGFPPHTYQLSYPAPGSPEVAARTWAMITELRVTRARWRRLTLFHAGWIER